MTFSKEKLWEPRATAAAAHPDAAEFAVARCGLARDEKQMEVLRLRPKRGILNCSRQWGKSTVAAAMAVHRVYTQPKSLVLIVSRSKRQSVLLLRTAAAMLRGLGIRPRGDGGPDPSLLLPNGSRIVALPGREDTIRGFSNISMILIDEAARVPDDVYKAMRPMLATSDGDLWLMSTPWGRRGFFYHVWAHGGKDWTRVRVPATECARIPQKFLEEERTAQGVWFPQEYMCEFMDREHGLFGLEVVEGALDGSVRTIEFEGLWAR